jgi:hypothetical protein
VEVRKLHVPLVDALVTRSFPESSPESWHPPSFALMCCAPVAVTYQPTRPVPIALPPSQLALGPGPVPYCVRMLELRRSPPPLATIRSTAAAAISRPIQDQRLRSSLTAGVPVNLGQPPSALTVLLKSPLGFRFHKYTLPPYKILTV